MSSIDRLKRNVAANVKMCSNNWKHSDYIEGAYDVFKEMEDILDKTVPIGYAYISKTSNTLTLVDEKHKDLPHVFPIYK